MNTKTIISVSWNRHRIQLIKRNCSSNFVTFDILQDRRVIKSDMITEKSAIWELLGYLRNKVITENL